MKFNGGGVAEELPGVVIGGCGVLIKVWGTFLFPATSNDPLSAL